MKALQCVELGGPDKLQINEVSDPEITAEHVIIDVKSASVNFPDVLMIQGLYQFQPPLPFTPGGESAGVVSEVGEGVTDYKVGDKVFAATGFGGISEKILAHQSMLRAIPKEMDYEIAAALSVTYGTSIYALKQRANIQPGETLLVLGASGGVGLATVQLGKAMGAKVIAAASTQEKVDVCIANGADEGFVYPSGNLDRNQQKELSNKVKELTGGMGPNVIYDPVGGSYAEPCLRSIAWEGRYLVIGFAAGADQIPKMPLNLTLLKGCQIVGVFWGAWAGMFPAENQKNFEELFSMYADGKINPEASDKFTLDTAADAIAHLADRKAKGKVVINF
ncbi:NADPH:quinone oxidoreductase family protein [Gammaproteobacteria bacterium]|nr:NADPH:quinone oxidoreductase family protein [Gammaproteobacteria bacterium]MDA9040534.1 NADPH:quinone oxidoreductase family protein [Gammaproteobacteria bacterium]MDA9054141.1 NADPH:quinone oxidoreductase family protein [Gammaproteobacteria bacterium]